MSRPFFSTLAAFAAVFLTIGSVGAIITVPPANALPLAPMIA